MLWGGELLLEQVREGRSFKARCKKPTGAAFVESECVSVRALDFFASKGNVPNQATTPLSREAGGKGGPSLFLCVPPLAGTVYASSVDRPLWDSSLSRCA